MASWRRVDSTLVKLMQYIIGSGVVTACETFALAYFILIAKALIVTGHVLSRRSLRYEKIYQCGLSVDGQNVFTVNRKTVQFDLDCVLLHVVKMFVLLYRNHEFS